MTDVGRSIVLAGVAVTLRHNRRKQLAIFRPTHIHPPMRCVSRTIACYAGWAYAIEGINTLLDRRKDIIWLRDTKQMPRATLGQDLVHPLDSLSHCLFLQRPTNTIAIKIHCAKACCGLLTQVLIIRPLQDTKERLIRLIWPSSPKTLNLC